MDQRVVACSLFGLIVLVIGGSEAITCYSCDSVNSSSCGDPFSAGGKNTCNGPTCTKGWASTQGVTVVIRGCNPTIVEGDGCVDVSSPGAKAIGCVCITNYCNDGEMLKPIHDKIVVALAMATIMAIKWFNKV